VSLSDLPFVNAIFNAICTIFLTLGFIQIKKKNREVHKKLMLSALVASTLFLISYLIYHYNTGSVPYPHHDWARPLYFAILIPHILLAGIMGPFILVLVWFALKENFEKHKRLARWTWPVWMFVSISGIVVYLMLYVL